MLENYNTLYRQVASPTAPEYEGRCYVQQWVDLLTYNLAHIGSRATGNDAASCLITSPRLEG
jgi:hypothetical protein